MASTLAEIALDEGLLTSESLANAARLSDSTGRSLVEIAVRELDVDEMALVGAIKKHLRISTLDPANVEFDSDAIRELSRDDSRRLLAVPLSIGEYGSGPRVLRVAMADPTAVVSLAELEHLSGCQVEPVLVTLSAAVEMVEAAYRHFVTEVMRRRDQTPRKSPSPLPKGELESRLGQLEEVVHSLVKLCLDKGVLSEDEATRLVATSKG